MLVCLKKSVSVSALIMAVNSVNAHAFLFASPSEPTIESILDAQESGSWSSLNLSDILGASWNVAGTSLSFSLVSENASYNLFQTLSLYDGSTSETIFEGVDSPNKTAAYTLTSDLTNFEFKTNFFLVSELNKYKIFISPTKSLYALAYDDTPNFTPSLDYNDMVVTFKVKTVAVPTPVPEPETLGMLLAGLGLMSVRLRNRSTKV